MKALSITRPWPHLILHCGKTIENRTWKHNYRGPIALHAAQSWDHDAITYAKYVELRIDRGIGLAAMPFGRGDHPTGIVAIANLVSICCDALCDCGPWAMQDQHHWHLTNIRALPIPVPCPGTRGLWDVPPHIAAAVDQLLAVAL